MPLILNFDINNHYKVMVWRIAKDEASEFIQNRKEESVSIPSHYTKRLEYFVSRHLINLLCDAFGISDTALIKSLTGQPRLRQASISISHAFPFISVALHNQTLPIGIDIDFPKSKHLKVVNRVFSTPEIDYIANDKQLACELWVCKESIYKCFDWGLSLMHNIRMNTIAVINGIKKYNFEVDNLPYHANNTGVQLDLLSKYKKICVSVQVQPVLFEKEVALLGFTIPLNQ